MLTIISGVIAALLFGLFWYLLPLLGPRGPKIDQRGDIRGRVEGGKLEVLLLPEVNRAQRVPPV